MTNEDKILKLLNEHSQILGIMQTQLKEYSAFIGSLQHTSEVHKADMDNLIHQVSAVSGELKALHVETNNNFNRLNERFDSIETDTGYLVSKVARLEKLAK